MLSFTDTMTSSSSSTEMLLYLSSTRVALDLTAPFKFAVTPFGDLARARLEAPPTAHEFAAVDRLTRLVAQPPARAQRSRSLVAATEVGRLAQVHQVCGRVLLEGGHFGRQDLIVRSRVVAEYHLGGIVKVLFNACADEAEVGHLVPAGARLAAARHAVTLALDLHVGRDHLSINQSIICQSR